MSDSFAQEINQQVADLTPSQQHEVLSFVQSLGKKSGNAGADRGTQGKSLLKFAGSIPHEDLESMRAAIEEGCGQVDLDGW